MKIPFCNIMQTFLYQLSVHKKMLTIQFVSLHMFSEAMTHQVPPSSYLFLLSAISARLFF